MQFLSPEMVPEAIEVIPNTSFWPDVDLAIFQKVMRTDGTVTPERLKQIVLTAIAEVNAELYSWREQQEVRGFNGLQDVPGTTLGGRPVREHHYLNAVWCWARAMISERYSDYTATGSGTKRGSELERASDDFWRDARWAISRVQDLPHCVVELI